MKFEDLQLFRRVSNTRFSYARIFKKSKESQLIYASKIFWISVSRLYTPSLTVNFWCLFSFNRKK